MSHSLLSEKLSELKTGDLLAWKTTRITTFFDFVLWLYQKIFKAEYTHVAVCVVIGKKQFLVEAIPPVVRLFPMTMSDDFYLIQTNLDPSDAHTNSLFQHLGKPYHLLDLLKGMIGFGSNSNNYYCSELAGGFYNDLGYIHDHNASLTPHALVEAIIKRSGNSPEFIVNDRGNIHGV